MRLHLFELIFECFNVGRLVSPFEFGPVDEQLNVGLVELVELLELLVCLFWIHIINIIRGSEGSIFTVSGSHRLDSGDTVLAVVLDRPKMIGPFASATFSHQI